MHRKDRTQLWGNEFLRFFNIGVLTALVDFFLFWFFISIIQTNLAIATTVAYCFAFFINFFGHSLHTFQVSPTFISLIRFSIIVLANYLISLVIILFGNEMFNAPLFWKVLSTGFVALNGYVLGHLWAFRK